MSHEPVPPPIDPLTVASLGLLPFGAVAALLCFFLGPLPFVAGLILAALGQRSVWRVLAIASHVVLLLASVAWIMFCLQDYGRGPF